MTGRYWDDTETIQRRLARALIVQEFGRDGVDALEYIRRDKRGE